VDLQFEQVRQKAQEQGIYLTLDAGVGEFLGKEGFDPAFGARPLKRVMQKMLVNPLSKRILPESSARGMPWLWF